MKPNNERRSWNHQGSTDSNSTMNTQDHAHTCRGCVTLKFVNANGLCQTCQEQDDSLNGALDALLTETEAINRGELNNRYVTVIVKDDNDQLREFRL